MTLLMHIQQPTANANAGVNLPLRAGLPFPQLPIESLLKNSAIAGGSIAGGGIAGAGAIDASGGVGGLNSEEHTADGKCVSAIFCTFLSSV